MVQHEQGVKQVKRLEYMEDDPQKVEYWICQNKSANHKSPTSLRDHMKTVKAQICSLHVQK